MTRGVPFHLDESEDAARRAARDDRYRAIVEQQSELISLAHPDGRLIYVNPAYASHFGRTPAQFEGVSLFDFIEPSDRDNVRRLLVRVFETGLSISGENRMRHADGSERWLAWTNSVHREPGQPPLLLSVGRDVTERRRAVQALRASQSFLTRTGRVAGVGGWELDLRSNLVTWSDETRRIHEVAPDYQPTLEDALRFYEPEGREAIAVAVAEGRRNGTGWDLELPLVTATGRSIWVRAVGEVEVEDGVAVRLIGALQDVTERRRLEQRVTDSERFLRQLTDSLPVRIAYIDRERRYRFVNLAHCERFGLERSQILGRLRSELTGGTSDATVNPRIDAVLEGARQRFEFDDTIRGVTRRIDGELIPDFAPDGRVQGFFATGIDVTVRTAVKKALRELTLIFEHTSDYVVQTDTQGRVTYMNPAARRCSGIGPDEPVTHRRFSEFNTPETNRLYAEVIMPAVLKQGMWLGQTTVLAAGGRVVSVSHMVLVHRDERGSIERFSAVMRDIGAELEAQQQLQRQTATLRSVTETIPALVAVVGADHRYRFVNSSFERWIGQPRERIVGHPMREVLGAHEYERSRAWVDRALAGESVTFEKEFPEERGARHASISYLPLRLPDGTVDGFVGVAQDITQHRQKEVRLLQLAQRDALTGLLNRAGFEEAMQRRLADAAGGSLALLCIDLDRFKPVNDAHGHAAGDQVLQMFARRLQGLVRPSDAVARIGGDEFAIVLAGLREPETAHQVAQTVAEKVIVAAGTPFAVGALQLRIGASVGITFGGAGGGSLAELLAQADAMLYRSKADGRGRHAGG